MEQNKIWDYYQNENIDSFEGSYSRLNDIVKQFNKNDKVLNIGVGGGVFEKIAKNFGLDVYSLDPSEKSIEKIKNYLGAEKAKVGYSQNIPFSNGFFNGVVMSEVIEHLDDNIIEQSLIDIERVIKSGGKFIGTVPYNENLNEQIVVCPNCGDKFHRWGHVQSFDIKRINNIIGQNFINISISKKNVYNMENT
jgi:ubiquinone/menaquinone biosynthesis C-methylase UbiE